MTFPVDNTFSDCYKNRKSCVERDFSAEVSVMILMKNQIKILKIGESSCEELSRYREYNL